MGKRLVEITVTPRQRVILKRVTRSKKGRTAMGRALPRGFAVSDGVAQRRGMSWALIASVFVAGDIAGRARWRRY